LLVYSQKLAAKIQSALATQLHPNVRVALGMTYGNPGIGAALSSLHQANVERLLVLPLFPQYSATSTAPAFDGVSRVLARWRRLPEVRFIMQYHDDPQYIAALAADVAAHWRTGGRKHLLFSFHGIPRRYLLAGDPYHCQCLKTARLVAERLQLTPQEWTAGFQSRFGREEWVGPYTEEILQRFGASGPKQLTVLCPGFATDCLETLEEIALRNRELFLSSGGELFEYVPALNATDSHVALLCSLIRRHCQGWPEAEPADAAASIAELAHTKARAVALGAAR
jgi:ferrochelatase